MGIKSIEEYIAKHGEEKGKKLHKQMTEREKKNSSAPYKRLSKEWFIWKHGEKEGLLRFSEFVSKSTQSLENFIMRYGEEEGTARYLETKSKKNTVAIARKKHGEEYIKDWYERASVSNRETKSKWTEIQKKRHSENVSAGLRKKYSGKTRLDVFIEKYGEAGPQKYGEYLCSIFKSIGASREATNIIESILEANVWLMELDVYYRTEGKSEYFISDKDGISFYDLTVLKTKTILEYDGARWHPSKEEVDLYSEDLMVVTGISYKDAFERDLKKMQRAISKGFKVFKIRSDFTDEQKSVIIKQFLDEVRNESSNFLQVHIN